MSELDPQTRREILMDLGANQKIKAIKRYRDATGAGLTDAKAAVDALESNSPFSVMPSTVAPPPAAERPSVAGRPIDDATRTAIIVELSQNRAIDAVKTYRLATGAGLTEAMAFIRTLQPPSAGRSRGSMQPATPSVRVMLACVVLVILLGAIAVATIVSRHVL